MNQSRYRRLPHIPYLAVHPAVGYAIFIISTLAFAFLTVQVVNGGPLTAADKPLVETFHKFAVAQPWYVTLVARIFSTIGRDGIALIDLGLLIGWMIRKWERELGMIIVGSMGAELAFEIISNVIKRQRPPFKDSFETLLGPGYPSGHATTAVALSWLILYLLWPHLSRGRRILFTAIAVVVGIGIGVSRLYLGDHYLTDIIAGYLLGFAWSGLVYTSIDMFFFRRRVTSEQVSMAD